MYRKAFFSYARWGRANKWLRWASGICNIIPDIAYIISGPQGSKDCTNSSCVQLPPWGMLRGFCDANCSQWSGEKKNSIDTNTFCSLSGIERKCFSGGYWDPLYSKSPESFSAAISMYNYCSPLLYPISSSGHSWNHSCSTNEPLAQPSAVNIVFLWHVCKALSWRTGQHCTGGKGL